MSLPVVAILKVKMLWRSVLPQYGRQLIPVLPYKSGKPFQALPACTLTSEGPECLLLYYGANTPLPAIPEVMPSSQRHTPFEATMPHSCNPQSPHNTFEGKDAYSVVLLRSQCSC